jgi:hypothetical protein
MRVRPLPLILAIFGAAALAAAFVVTQLPREGEAVPVAASAEQPAPLAAQTPPLEPPARATDGTVEVRASAGGEPLRDAAVRLYAMDAGGGWWLAGEARTEAGTARLHARPGPHLVSVRAPGLSAGRAEVVPTASEEVTRVAVALEPAATLAGRVVARDGAPVAGAELRLVPLVSRWPGLGPPSAPAEEVARVATDASGAFVAEGLAPGVYAVDAEAPRFHPARLLRVTVPGDPLAIALEPLGEIAGRVTLPDGRPAAEAAVRAASVDHGATATAGADGSFTLAVPAGSFVVHATRGEQAGAAAGPVAVGAGATTGGLEVRLGPGAVLEGEVVHARSGGPAAGATIAVLPHETGEVIARAEADVAGRFAIAGLPAGAFDVRAAARDASPAVVSGVTLGAGARFPVRLALEGTGAAEGLVADDSGRPLAGVHVRVVQRGDGIVAGATLETRSGFDGAWRIEGIEVGRADLVARQDGVSLGVARSVRVAAGRTSRADLFLPTAGLLVGRVTRDGKPPPPGTTVVALPLEAGLGTLQVARADADGTGNYRLALPAGEYRVHAAPPGEVRTDLRVAPRFARVAPGVTARLDVSVTTAANQDGVELLVLEPGGAPSPGAVVTLGRPDDDKVAFATSAGEDGRVLLGREMGLAGRPVVIRARNGGRTGAATVELPASGTVAVTLQPGGAVQGVVRSPGRAVAGFTLEVASQPATGSWRTVNVHRFAGDRFELGDLPSEPLRLLVRAEDGRRGAADVRLAAGDVRTVEIALER